MAVDPFKPPQASLELDDDLGPVPVRVKMAVVAIITGAVTSFTLKVAMSGDVLPSTLPLLLLCVLAWKIFVGRDWARWILGALVGLGAFGLASLFYPPAGLAVPMPQYLLVASVIQFALNSAAFVLLLTEDGAKWFRR